MREMLVLVNLDSRTTRYVARLLRSEGIYCVVIPADASVEEIPDSWVIRGIILCGGGEGEAPFAPHLKELIATGAPVLALGDAALTLCRWLGGQESPEAEGEGVRQVRFHPNVLTTGVQDGERWMKTCRPMLPVNAEVLAEADCGILAFQDKDRALFAVDFLIERNDVDGSRLLSNFCVQVCACASWWNERQFIDMAVEDIARAADGGDVVCSVSGGVDSTVCAMLARQAVGDRLHCLFVDTGLLREGEAERVPAELEGFGLPVKRVDAREDVLAALEGIEDPAEKERAVFARLRAILRREVSALPDARVILRGTNYSDAFDREPFQTGDLPGARVRFVEPVRYLFKDEIRRVAELMKLPPEVCGRQPFPGSGLALRLVGPVTAEGVDALRRADAILREEIEQAGQNKRLWQYYALMSGDPLRAGRALVVLRAVQAVGDGAAAARLPSDLLERVTRRILEEIPSVSRVLYDYTPSSTYGKVEWR